MRDYLESIKFPAIFTTVLFLAMIFIGFVFGSKLDFFWEYLGSFYGIFQGHDPLELFIMIFLNNSLTSLMTIILGVVFGTFPILVSLENGLVVGLAGFHTLPSRGLVFFLLALTPHGIVEIPVFLLSSAVGIKVGWEALNRVLGRDSKVREEFRKGLKFYVMFILPLLFLAAFIEVFVTLSLF